MDRLKLLFYLAFYYEVPQTIVYVQHRRDADRLAVALALEDFLAISISS